MLKESAKTDCNGVNDKMVTKTEGMPLVTSKLYYKLVEWNTVSWGNMILGKIAEFSKQVGRAKNIYIDVVDYTYSKS